MPGNPQYSVFSSSARLSWQWACSATASTNQEATGRPPDQCWPERTEDTKQVKRNASIMMISSIKQLSVMMLGGCILFALVPPTLAQQVSREQDNR